MTIDFNTALVGQPGPKACASIHGGGYGLRTAASTIGSFTTSRRRAWAD